MTEENRTPAAGDPSCGCCEGVEPVTPQSIYNRPGLPALAYRVGVHATFLETMLARLSLHSLTLDRDEAAAAGLPVSEGQAENGAPVATRPLQGLRVHGAPSPGAALDPASALLDAWASVGDVLTFYQERIANEGYLRTATERRSVVELGRLVGYRLRPGVSASVFLAYTLDKDSRTTLPAGSRAQSVPGPDELPQSFETSSPLEARGEWNNLQPRQVRRQVFQPVPGVVYLKGLALNLKPNDPLLVVDEAGQPTFVRIGSVELLSPQELTKVTLQNLAAPEEIASHVAAIKVLLANQPEEEGPYSRAIGDQEANRLKAKLNDLLTRLTASPLNKAEMKEAAGILLPLVEAQLRVVAALNFDFLAEWLGSLRRELLGIWDALPAPSQGRTDPSLAEIQAKIQEIRLKLSAMPQIQRRPFMNEIARPELERTIRLLGALSGEERFQRLVGGFLGRLLTQGELPAVESYWVAIQALVGILESLAEVATHLGFSTEKDNLGLNDWMLGLGNLLKETFPPAPAPLPGQGQTASAAALPRLVQALAIEPSRPPLNEFRLGRQVKEIFAYNTDAAPRLIANFQPRVGDQLYTAWKNASGTPSEVRKVYALRLTASLFGGSAQPPQHYDQDAGKIVYDGEWKVSGEAMDQLFLDGSQDKVLPGSWVVVDTAVTPITDGELHIARANTVRAGINRAAYGLASKATQVTLVDYNDPSQPGNWMSKQPTESGQDATCMTAPCMFEAIRQTVVYAQSEALPLADAPIDPLLEPVGGDLIELSDLYDGLASGRWLVVQGERADILDADGKVVSGIQGTELAMLANVLQQPDARLPGDATHSWLQLANPLAYQYKRDAVAIFGNVVKATHGETHPEVLGSGDGSLPFQSFSLHHLPLTYVAAPTPDGVESALQVRVNKVLWREAARMTGLGPYDRAYLVKIDDDGSTQVIFGDGEHGARLPTGSENVQAQYRSGLGKAGNVRAGQISLLVSRPLGAKEVINPLPASGGADPEGLEQARWRVPLALLALDRLVSTQDYADFARTFAGIGKASAVRLPLSGQALVHLTIAGEGNIPIDTNSDLYQNLEAALLRYGDPHQPLRIDLYRPALLVIQAGIHPLPEYLWEDVAARVQAALLGAFSFEARDLGQDVYASEVLAAIQAVEGVDYADLDILDSVDQQTLLNFLEQSGEDQESAGGASPANALGLKYHARLVVDLAMPGKTGSGKVSPAGLAYLDPQQKDTLVLTLIP